MRAEHFAGGRLALRFGEQKINLHEAGAEFEPHALRPVPGSADLCFLVDGPLADVARELGEAGVAIELGPVAREGAVGAMDSLYLRDPDGNLVELSQPRSLAAYVAARIGRCSGAKRASLPRPCRTKSSTARSASPSRPC